MTDEGLTLSEDSAAWMLRAAWAGRWEVGVTLRRGRRLRGYVESVAPSSACAWVWTGDGLTHVPTSLVAAVSKPHFLEPSWGEPVSPPPPREPALVMDHQLSFQLEGV